PRPRGEHVGRTIAGVERGPVGAPSHTDGAVGRRVDEDRTVGELGGDVLCVVVAVDRGALRHVDDQYLLPVRAGDHGVCAVGHENRLVRLADPQFAAVAGGEQDLTVTAPDRPDHVAAAVRRVALLARAACDGSEVVPV